MRNSCVYGVLCVQQNIHTFVESRLFFDVALNVFRKPLGEFFMWIEQGRHDEMQQSPQLQEKQTQSFLDMSDWH